MSTLAKLLCAGFADNPATGFKHVVEDTSAAAKAKAPAAAPAKGAKPRPGSATAAEPEVAAPAPTAVVVDGVPFDVDARLRAARFLALLSTDSANATQVPIPSPWYIASCGVSSLPVVVVQATFAGDGCGRDVTCVCVWLWSQLVLLDAGVVGWLARLVIVASHCTGAGKAACVVSSFLHAGTASRIADAGACACDAAANNCCNPLFPSLVAWSPATC